MKVVKISSKIFHPLTRHAMEFGLKFSLILFLWLSVDVIIIIMPKWGQLNFCAGDEQGMEVDQQQKVL